MPPDGGFRVAGRQSRSDGLAVPIIRGNRFDDLSPPSRISETAVSLRQVRRLAGLSRGSRYIDGVKPEMKNGLLNSYYG